MGLAVHVIWKHLLWLRSGGPRHLRLARAGGTVGNYSILHKAAIAIALTTMVI